MVKLEGIEEHTDSEAIQNLGTRHCIIHGTSGKARFFKWIAVSRPLEWYGIVVRYADRFFAKNEIFCFLSLPPLIAERRGLMLTRERLALRLKRKTGGIWVCRRCISQTSHQFSQRIEHRELSEESSKSKSTDKESPGEVWRTAFSSDSKFANSHSEPSPSPSPAEAFRNRWAKSPTPEAKPAKSNFSLDQLAEEYRRSGTSRKYVKGDIWLFNPKEEKKPIKETEEETTLAPDLDDLSRLDEVEISADVDIFAGENMRDYQGVIPLNGHGYEQVKYPLKLGMFVETRG